MAERQSLAKAQDKGDIARIELVMSTGERNGRVGLPRRKESVSWRVPVNDRTMSYIVVKTCYERDRHSHRMVAEGQTKERFKGSGLKLRETTMTAEAQMLLCDREL